MKVTKNIKKNKAADPKGLINELFKPGMAGSDLLKARFTIVGQSD